MNNETMKLRDSFAEEKAAEVLEAMEKAMNEETPKQAASYGEPDNKTALERLADVLEMPADHIREAAQAIRQERKENALLEKVRLIREGNTAILKNGEIVPRGTPGSMNYDTASCNASYGEPWPEKQFTLCKTEYERARQCVNACAGIADPENAIQAAREALNLAANRLERLQIECEYGKSIRFNAAEWVQETRAALAQLNNTK